jgi:hypothetical protein
MQFSGLFIKRTKLITQKKNKFRCNQPELKLTRKTTSLCSNNLNII